MVSTHSPSSLIKPVFFGDRDELGGRDHATLGVTPAHQRFTTGDAVVLEADAGLVIDLERAVRDRLAQIHFQNSACLDPCVHYRLEDPPGPASGRFGRIHGQIRVLQDLVKVGAVLGSQSNADAGVGCDLMTETFAGRANCVECACGEVGDVGLRFDRGLDDGEFVAEPATNSFALAQRPRLTATDFSNSSPTRWPSVSLTLLNSSTSIYNNRQLFARNNAGQFLLEALVKQRAVRQIGQCIVVARDA